MGSNPLNHKTKYYAGAENSNSEWLRRFIIKHNSHTANRVPNWELPRLRMIVQILFELEQMEEPSVQNLLASFSDSDFSEQKTKKQEVAKEELRVNGLGPSALDDLRRKFPKIPKFD